LVRAAIPAAKSAAAAPSIAPLPPPATSQRPERQPAARKDPVDGVYSERQNGSALRRLFKALDALAQRVEHGLGGTHTHVREPAAYLETLNPEQRRAVEHGVRDKDCTPGVPLLVIAGAGSGKTNTLAHRVAHLIVNGADPRRILLRPSRAVPRPATSLACRSSMKTI